MASLYSNGTTSVQVRLLWKPCFTILYVLTVLSGPRVSVYMNWLHVWMDHWCFTSLVNWKSLCGSSYLDICLQLYNSLNQQWNIFHDTWLQYSVEEGHCIRIDTDEPFRCQVEDKRYKYFVLVSIWYQYYVWNATLQFVCSFLIHHCLLVFLLKWSVFEVIQICFSVSVASHPPSQGIPGVIKT